jgi:hypothetical protein
MIEDLNLDQELPPNRPVRSCGTHSQGLRSERSLL